MAPLYSMFTDQQPILRGQEYVGSPGTLPGNASPGDLVVLPYSFAAGAFLSATFDEPKYPNDAASSRSASLLRLGRGIRAEFRQPALERSEWVMAVLEILRR